MKYKKNSEVEVTLKPDYSKKIIFPLSDFIEKGYLLQTVTIPANTKQRSHKHFKQTEVCFILSGQATTFINDQEFISIPGDSFIVNPGEFHSVWNKSATDFTFLVFKINMPRNDDDTQWLEV